jgi:hypothetical protein
MKTALLLLAASIASYGQIPWGLHRQGDVVITALLQRLPPGSISVAEPRPKYETEGVMVNVNSPDLVGDAKVEVTMFVGVILENGRYVFEERTIAYDKRFPTTILFPVGRATTLIRLKATIRKSVEVD